MTIKTAISLGASNFSHALAISTLDCLTEQYGDTRGHRIWNGTSDASRAKVCDAIWHAVNKYSEEIKS